MKKGFPYELIGEEVEVIESTNPSELNFVGKVVDETKFTLKIEYSNVIKTLFKKNVVLKLKRTNQVINGKEIAKRSEERLKG
ncbi:MAG: ribonuclease P protein subunit [Candidatus Woesearchaeota archaeon]|jgi:RNase P/RNase MRP subunit p29